MKKLYKVLAVVMLASLVLAACGQAAAKPTTLLDAIKQRGYILVSTDPNYEPQSFLNTEGKRPANTKCPSDALTTAEMQGFDVDVAKKIGEGLGVETCFATPAWDAITAGGWAYGPRSSCRWARGPSGSQCTSPTRDAPGGPN